MLTFESDGEFLQRLGQNIKTIRLRQNLTQADVSRRSLVPLPSYKYFEKTGQIHIGKFLAIATTLGLRGTMDTAFSPPLPTQLTEMKQRRRAGRPRKSTP
jgi:transcriptional regulator with XRE-family HTH domain